MDEYPIGCLVESLVEEYIKIRKRVFKEEDYKQYSYYHTGIEGKSCDPINILKVFISLIKDLKLKEYPERSDFKFIRDTSKVYIKLYDEIYSEEGLKIGSVVLSKDNLIKVKFILENIYYKKASYYSFLTLFLGVLFAMLSILLPNLFPNIFEAILGEKLQYVSNFFFDLILFVAIIFIFWGSLPQLATNILFKSEIYKELLTIIDRRIKEFEERSKSKKKGENNEA